MGEFPVLFNAELNTTILASTSMVFHCHYYNCAIQKVIEEAMGEKAKNVFQQAALIAVLPQLARLIEKEENLESKFERGFALLKQLGFGYFDFSQLNSIGGVVTSNSSHYALGWLSEYAEREQPICDFITGYIQALFAVALNVASEQVKVREAECMATGSMECRFVVEMLSELK